MPLSANIMSKSFLAACCALAVWGGGSANAQTTLSPAKERISDQAIVADQQAYEQLQQRLHAINEAGRPLRDYHLSKAQCWLDVSLHEYTRNDRSAFPQEALEQSEKLILGMERKATPLPMDTPLVNGAAKLRPDLWERALAVRGHAGFACAAQKAACAEVELVHAGNEHQQQQWRHAKPYVQIAEDLVAQAESAATACVAPAAPAPACVVTPAAVCTVPAPAAPVPVSLAAGVVFNFDHYGRADIRPASLLSLQELIRQVKLEGFKLDKIRLTGHADRLNGTGKKTYNQELSRKRAETVLNLLVEAGLPASSMSYEYVGDTQQIVKCDGQYKNTAELEECLLPNRRVQVELQGVRAR